MTRKILETCAWARCDRPTVPDGIECAEHYARHFKQIVGFAHDNAYVWVYEYSDDDDPRPLRLVTSQTDIYEPAIGLDVDDLLDLADQINEWRERPMTIWDRAEDELRRENERGEPQ